MYLITDLLNMFFMPEEAYTAKLPLPHDFFVMKVYEEGNTNRMHVSEFFYSVQEPLVTVLGGNQSLYIHGWFWFLSLPPIFIFL